MQELISGSLWIGNTAEARQPTKLHQQGIRAVVDLAYEVAPAALPRELIAHRIPLSDGDGNDASSLRLAIESVERLIQAGIPALVACSAGLSRSPLIAAAAVARVENSSFEEILHRIQAVRPLDISPALLRDVAAAWQSQGM